MSKNILSQVERLAERVDSIAMALDGIELQKKFGKKVLFKPATPEMVAQRHMALVVDTLARIDGKLGSISRTLDAIKDKDIRRRSHVSS